MLLYDDSSLLLVELLDALPHPELDIEVGDSLVEYAPLQFWFDHSLPDVKWIDVQIIGESSGDNDSALEFSACFCRYGQAPLVVKLSFEVVQSRIPFSLALNLLVPWFFCFCSV